MARRMTKEAAAPPPEMTAEALASWNRKIEAAADANASAAGSLQNLWKQAKEAGVDADALRIVRKLAKLDEPVAQARLRAINRYAELLGLTDQADLFEQDAANATTPPDGQVTTAKAYGMGHTAGLAGKVNPDQNPFDSDPQRRQWQEGWQDGQEELAKKSFGAPGDEVAGVPDVPVSLDRRRKATEPAAA